MIPLAELKKLHIFSSVSEKGLERLAGDMEAKTFSLGDVICQEGEQSHGIYLLASGQVSIQKKLAPPSRETKTVARIESEEFFGEMSFLDNLPYSASVVADGNCEVFVLPRATIFDLMEKDPRAALDHLMLIMSAIGVRLRRTTAESVTAFEVARIVGQGLPVRDFAEKVLRVLLSGLRVKSTIGLYRWNPFNDEYSRLVVLGDDSDSFPDLVDILAPALRQTLDRDFFADLSVRGNEMAPFPFAQGSMVISPVNMGGTREALLAFYAQETAAFDTADKQLIETISSVLAPAMSTARAREEEEARIRFQRTKLEGEYL